jgi:hypothetical protein
MNGPNKRECLSLASLSSLMLIKHSSLLETFLSYEKMKFCEYGPLPYNNKLECFVTVRHFHSSLILNLKLNVVYFFQHQC